MLTRIEETLQKAKEKDHAKHISVLQSFAKAHKKWVGLTSGQLKYFESIEASYSPAAVAADAEWVKQLKDPEYRKRLSIVAEYYGRTGYYGALGSKVRTYLNGTSNDVPDRARVLKMMDNKYAENVLESTLSAPLFETGDLVQFRSTVKNDTIIGGGWRLLEQIKKSVLTIVQVDSRPIDKSLSYHQKNGGTRYYKVLPFGTTELVEVMERDLKRPTKKLLRGE